MMMKDGKTTSKDDDEHIPWLQKVYDRPFLLLFLGIVVMFGFYTIWGMWEVLSLPQATLP